MRALLPQSARKPLIETEDSWGNLRPEDLFHSSDCPVPGDQPVNRWDVHLVSQVLSGSALTVVYHFALTLKRNLAFMPP